MNDRETNRASIPERALRVGRLLGSCRSAFSDGREEIFEPVWITVATFVRFDGEPEPGRRFGARYETSPARRAGVVAPSAPVETRVPWRPGWKMIRTSKGLKRRAADTQTGPNGRRKARFPHPERRPTWPTAS